MLNTFGARMRFYRGFRKHEIHQVSTTCGSGWVINMKSITFLKLLFIAILIGMLIVTIKASLYENVFKAGRILNEPWVIATLWDAYCGFLTFYVWVVYKETKWWARILWFVMIMSLGNIAMAVYMLIQLFRLPVNATMKDLLLRKGN